MLITKILGPVNVPVQKGPRAKGQVVHIDKLKKCEGVTPRSWLTVELATERRAPDEPLDSTTEAPRTAPGLDSLRPAREEEVTDGVPPADARGGTEKEGVGEAGAERRTMGAPPPAATSTEPTTEPNIRRQPPRNAGMPKRYLQRGRVEEEGARTAYRLHTLRCH